MQHIVNWTGVNVVLIEQKSICFKNFAVMGRNQLMLGVKTSSIVGQINVHTVFTVYSCCFLWTFLEKSFRFLYTVLSRWVGCDRYCDIKLVNTCACNKCFTNNFSHKNIHFNEKIIFFTLYLVLFSGNLAMPTTAYFLQIRVGSRRAHFCGGNYENWC